MRPVRTSRIFPLLPYPHPGGLPCSLMMMTIVTNSCYVTPWGAAASLFLLARIPPTVRQKNAPSIQRISTFWGFSRTRHGVFSSPPDTPFSRGKAPLFQRPKSPWIQRKWLIQLFQCTITVNANGPWSEGPTSGRLPYARISADLPAPRSRRAHPRCSRRSPPHPRQRSESAGTTPTSVPPTGRCSDR